MNQIEEKLQQYHALAQKTHEITDNEILGKSDEFNNMLEIEEAVLHSYGLPLGRPYQSILENFGWEEKLSERKIIRVISELKNSAVRFHHSAVESNEQTLCWGKENFKPFDYVLPLMGFTPTAYNVFLYTYLWLRKNYPVKNIIREMKLAKTFSKELNLACVDRKHSTVATGLLRKAGAKYADEFKACLKKEHLSKALIKDIDTGYAPLFGNNYTPQILEISKCYIEAVRFHNKENNDLSGEVGVVLYLMYDNRWQQYAIDMPLKEFQTLLLHCTQTELSDLMNVYANEYKESTGNYRKYINIRRDEKAYLECNASIKAVLTSNTDCWIMPPQYGLLSLGKT